MNELIKNLVLDPADGKFYLIRERTPELVRLSPLADLSRQVVLYEPAALLYLNKIEDIRHTNGIKTDFKRIENGTTTDQQRTDNDVGTAQERDDNGQTTDNQPRAICCKLEEQQQLIGAGKVNLKPFAEASPVEVQDVARRIEALLARALDGTNKPATIENLMRLHKQAATLAAAGNIFKLKQTEQRLRGIVNKQAAMRASEKTVKRRQRRRQFLIKIFVSLFVISAGAGVMIVKKRAAAPSVTSREQEAVTTVKASSASLSPTPLQAAFAEYEKESGRKLYPGGRACIERAAKSSGFLNDKNKIKKLIYQNTK